MSKIRNGVAMSLDGYIAGPNGEADWIVGDGFEFRGNLGTVRHLPDGAPHLRSSDYWNGQESI